MPNLKLKAVVLALLAGRFLLAQERFPTDGLLVDLDADAGVEVQGQQVLSWRNKAQSDAALFIATRDTGRPILRKSAPELNGHNAVVFNEQDLLCENESVFDGLTTGAGHTWIVVLCAHKQNGKLKDVNAFLGNLRNGGLYEGFWAGFDDDNRVWMGSRNGKSFGRWNADNPKLKGPILEEKRFYVLAGRMGAGAETALLELFVNGRNPAASASMPVNPKADPSVLAIGTERNAKEHPGVESFDGEMARILIWKRALGDKELEGALDSLVEKYGIKKEQR